MGSCRFGSPELRSKNTALAVFSVSDRPKYLPFLPLVGSAWRKLGFEPLCVYVTEKSEQEIAWTRRYSTVHVWRPLAGFEPGHLAIASRALVAQSLPPESLVLLTDVDMLPLDGRYFHDLAERVEGGRVVLAGADAPGYGRAAGRRYPICYMVARAGTFRDLINPEGLGLEPLVRHLDASVRRLDSDDESLLSLLFQRWPAFNDFAVELPRPGGWPDERAAHRIDRASWEIDEKKLREGGYLDAHLPRPVLRREADLRRLAGFLCLDPGLVRAGARHLGMDPAALR